MAYQCADCSYKGNRVVNGLCPACGSGNISKVKTATAAEEEKEARPMRLVMMIILWSVLLYKAYEYLFILE